MGMVTIYQYHYPPKFVMVNIYMKESDNGEWICALNIQQEDIVRLFLWPLKWLHFVTFTVLDAKGDLFDGPVPGSNIINYKLVLHMDLTASYYYFIPDDIALIFPAEILIRCIETGRYQLADNQGLNDCTSSATLQCHSPFL